MKIRILDTGFLPGWVYLVDDYVPEFNREELKTEMQKSSARALAFDDSELSLSEDSVGGCHRIDNSGVVVVFIKPGIKGTERALTMIHEMLHATAHVLRHAEIKHSSNSEEIYAYLQEHLLRQTGEF